MAVADKPGSGTRGTVMRLPGAGTVVVAILIVVFGFYILGPVALIVVNSFNVGDLNQTVWGWDNWRTAFTTRGLFEAVGNTFLIYGSYTIIGFPVAILIAWTLARTNIRYSGGLEFMFWVSFMLPSIATTIGWVFLLHPDVGVLNQAFEKLPFVGPGLFNIFSVAGIVWAHLMSNTISGVVMLLTPAFRNMDNSLEEAGRVSGASNLGTLTRVTLPVMLPAISVVFMLNLVRIFQSFETEQILGTRFDFYVYSTKIFQFIRFFDPPQYGPATALASITLIFIALIIPLQRWVVTRKQYTTVTGNFKPGLQDLGPWRVPIFVAIVALIFILTVVPIATLLGGSFMTRAGWFNVTPLFTMRHWGDVLGDPFFINGLKNTFLLSISTAVITPLMFSFVAYVIVRTKWRGRAVLDSLFWMSAAIPGILASLGLLWLFLKTPFLTPLFGTLYALVIVVILSGKLTSSQLIKGAYLQIGSDMEEAARVCGAGWMRTYFRIWIPLLMPTLVLIGTLNFVIAASTTSTIILLASRGTTTLSLLALQMMTHSNGIDLEGAGIVSLFIVAMTAGVALIARRFGLRLGLSHQTRAAPARAEVAGEQAKAAAPDKGSS